MQEKPALRGPRGANDAAALVAQPVVSGPGVCTSSNLDSTRTRIVKRRVKVSYQGVRAQVAAVRLGRCCVEYVDYLGRKTGSSEWLGCHLVQVVS
jgi:hypothetical protein